MPRQTITLPDLFVRDVKSDEVMTPVLRAFGPYRNIPIVSEPGEPVENYRARTASLFLPWDFPGDHPPVNTCFRVTIEVIPYDEWLYEQQYASDEVVAEAEEKGIGYPFNQKSE